MSVVAPPRVPPQPPSPQPDPDALIKEARARQRRRRRRLALVVVVAAAVGTAVGITYGPGGGGPAVVHLAGGPRVDVAAFAGQGRLAFVSRNELYLVDGAAGSVHEVPVQAGWTALRPGFSHDGKWIAYETEAQNGNAYASPGPDVWIARADGSDRHRVAGADGFFGWSPSRDVIAISTDTRVRFPGGGTGEVATRVDLVTPDGTRRRLVTLSGAREADGATGYRIWSAVWAPSGTALAVSLVSGTNGSIVRSYPIDGHAPTTWFAINGKTALPGVCSTCGGGGTIADLAGWWPKWGIGFWVFSSGMVHNNDSTPVEVVNAPGARPRIVGWTLSDRTTDALAVSKTGSFAIVSSAMNAGRDYGNGKEIETCDLASERCTPIPGGSTWTGKDPLLCPKPCSPGPRLGAPGSAVSIDPAWSPTQNLLAYVKSPHAYNGGNPPAAWYRAHELFVYDPATRRSTRIAAVDGVSVPTWSSDGKHLLYVSGDGLWLTGATGGTPTEIATPLFGGARWLRSPGMTINYYGQVPWTDQFSWWTATGARGS